MNERAERHLVRAEKHLARGDEFYGKAADEIIAAQEADPQLSQREIGERFGRSARWVRDLVQWRTSGESTPTPWKGERSTAELNAMATRKVLRESPLEQVEQIISGLPEERQQAVAAAAGAPDPAKLLKDQKVLDGMSDDEITEVGQAVTEQRVKRLIPVVQEGNRKHRAQQTERLKKNPLEALMRFGSTLSSGRAAVRVIVQAYQEFLAVVDDEDVREEGRDMLVAYRASLDVSLGEVLEGSYEDALARLIEKEEAR